MAPSLIFLFEVKVIVVQLADGGKWILDVKSEN
jgi:hypothetical protein